MTLLVCEGACNPELPMIDAAVNKHRHAEFSVNKSGTRLPIPDEKLIAKLRALRHTEHEQVAPLRWRCATCHAERVF